MTDETTAPVTADATAPVADTAPTTQAPVVDASAADTAPAPVADAPAVADWRASITDPDALEFAKRVATPADAVKIAMDLRKANGSMVKVPGKDATAEDRAKFNKAIGVPDSVDGYVFELGREATDADKAIHGNLAKIALENGIPANAMSALSKAVTELATAQKAEENRVAVQNREKAEAELRKEWGADYDANKTLASRAVSAFGEVKSHPEVVTFLDNTMINGMKLGDHPVMVRMLGNIGRRMGEGEFIGAVGSDQRASLQSELNQIMRDNPPGSAKYASPEIQKRVSALHDSLHGNAGIVGMAGRSA